MAGLVTPLMTGAFVMETSQLMVIDGPKKLLFFTGLEHLKSAMMAGVDPDQLANFENVSIGYVGDMDNEEVKSFVQMLGSKGEGADWLLTYHVQKVGQRHVSVTYTLVEA